jgi:hypothetical protein
VVRSVLIEAALLLVLGMVLGATLGPTGVVVAMLIAAVGGGVELYRFRPACPSPVRALVDNDAAYATATLALVAVAAQADLLAAPEALGADEVGTFAIAAMGGKAVFVALMAAGSAIYRIAASDEGAVRRRVGAVGLLGVGLSAVVVAATPLIARALDSDTPDRATVLLCGLAMTLAAANWVASVALVVRKARALVVPLVVLVLFGLFLLVIPPPVLALEATMLLAQAGGLVVALAMVRRTPVAARVA